MNKGENMETLSGDLTGGGKKGDVSYGTLTSIHESPLRFGLIYVGSDDGFVHVSKDVGYTWENISTGLPKNLWISRVQASAHQLERVFLSLNGYRWDDFTPYLYVSDNYGKTWQKIGNNLPQEPINVVKEDPDNENIIYVGTDNGLYISFDRGLTFSPMMNRLPNVAVHDLVIHPRDHEIIIGTHGRSLYKADVSVVQQLDSAILHSDLTLFDAEKVNYSSHWGNSWSVWKPANEPSVNLVFFMRNLSDSSPVTIKISSPDGLELFTSTPENINRGLNYIPYNLSISEKKVKAFEKELNKEKQTDDKEIKLEKADNGNYFLMPGKYSVEVSNGKESRKTELEIIDK